MHTTIVLVIDALSYGSNTGIFRFWSNTERGEYCIYLQFCTQGQELLCPLGFDTSANHSLYVNVNCLIILHYILTNR